jgi:hypothetical protein
MFFISSGDRDLKHLKKMQLRAERELGYLVLEEKISAYRARIKRVRRAEFDFN